MQYALLLFPDLSLASRERGSIYKIGILGCADLAVVHNKTLQSCDTVCVLLDCRTGLAVQ